MARAHQASNGFVSGSGPSIQPALWIMVYSAAADLVQASTRNIDLVETWNANGSHIQ